MRARQVRRAAMATGRAALVTSGPAYGSSYAAQRSGYTMLGRTALTLALPGMPYPAGQAAGPATAATAPATRSTPVINTAANPARPPGRKLGEMLRTVTSGTPAPAGQGG